MAVVTLLVVLVFILVVGLIVGIVFLALRRSPEKIMERADAKEKSLLENATPGEAKIIEVGDSLTTNGSTDVGLQLEVTPQFGESYNAFTVWSIEPVHLPEIQAGKSFTVKIVEVQSKKSSSKKFKSIFPDMAWAKLYGWGTEYTQESMKTLI